MFGLPLPYLIPLGIFVTILVISLTSRLITLNNDLAKAKENEILNRELMRKQVEEAQLNLDNARQGSTNAAYDRELNLLIQNKRLEDAIEYIDERRRLAFEQGNIQREDMYMRYRRDLENEIAERDSTAG